MKKKIISIFLVFFLAANVFSLDYVDKANNKIALNYLQAANECIHNEDWINAIEQSNTGLAYDNDISDLMYIKALAENNLACKPADVIELLLNAFKVNNWYNYSQGNARILLANLLSDVGQYNNSLDILNMAPYINSADADFIRILNHYRIGTLSSLENARAEIESSRHVYPNDERFLSLFFKFESMYEIESEVNNLPYEKDEIVTKIVNDYAGKLPNYHMQDDEIEVLASFLVDEENRERIIKSISAKNNSENVMLVLAQMKIGMISDSQALENFFNYSNGNINLKNLELFSRYLKDDNVKQDFIEIMTNFDGIIYIDQNHDLLSEYSIIYDLGRPKFITFDANNDGNIDVSCDCDYGSPTSIIFDTQRFEFVYDTYPNIYSVSQLDEDITFKFINDDFTFNLIEMKPNNCINDIGLIFYIPEISSDCSIPDEDFLIEKVSALELPIKERNNARISFSMLKGNLFYASFYENDYNYANCDFSIGFPVTRYVDYDNDGHFETSEIYDTFTDNTFINEENSESIRNIFGSFIDNSLMYLKKVQIDRNSNTNYEFTEEYFEEGGSVTTWDNDDNGLPDCQYIKYPVDEDNLIKEETIFYNSNGVEQVAITMVNGIPEKIVSENRELTIIKGNNENFYWLENNEGSVIEGKIIEYLGKGISQGVIKLLTINNKRYSVIRIENDIFAKQIQY